MEVKNILVSHINEALGNNEELSKTRMAICEQCPLMISKPWGLVCDSSKYVNPETKETSYIPLEGYYKGCGCRLNAKTRREDNHCPSKQW